MGFRVALAIAGIITLTACGGGSGGGAPAEPEVTTKAAAQRLLLQAAFGGSFQDISDVSEQGATAWVDQQLSMASAYDDENDNWPTHLQRTIEIAKAAEPNTDYDAGGIFNQSAADGSVLDYQMSAWWENALGSQSTPVGSDVLRQRVAYALSQILVVSNTAGSLRNRAEGLAAYYDILAKHAFGNFRDLIGDVSRSPTMGVFLSHQGNQKANLVANTQPDENFARELLQLFTIGLYDLNLDGSPNRDGNAASYPDSGSTLVSSYSQVDVEELSKVMTGWDLQENRAYGRAGSRQGSYLVPMEFTPAEHEGELAEGGDGLVSFLGTEISLSATDNDGVTNSGLDAALDVIFQHPNVGPFISKQLIQRLVSSNPSSAYVARVAAVFNNHNGVKGDLKAVVRAILLDTEARNPSQDSAGKLKEPVLAIAQLLKAVNVLPLEGWRSPQGEPMPPTYWYKAPQNDTNQGPLRSPSVFNFYTPDHVPSAEYFANRNLVAPEEKIVTSQMLVTFSNRIYDLLHTFEKNKIVNRDGETIASFSASRRSGSNALFLTNFDEALAVLEQALDGDQNGDFAQMESTDVDVDTGLTPKASAVSALLDYVDLLLLGGEMDSGYRAALLEYLVNGSGVNSNNNSVEEARIVVRDAFHLVASSGAYMALP